MSMASGMMLHNPLMLYSFKVSYSSLIQPKMVSSGKGMFLHSSLVLMSSSVAVLQKRCLPTPAEEISSDGGSDGSEPMNPSLRNGIIRCHAFVDACNKAFDNDPESKRYLNCKYGKTAVLGEVGLEDYCSGYEVTKYIYATPDVSVRTLKSCSRWIGYVAVAGDAEVQRLGKREIVVAFRGTVTNAEWFTHLMCALTPGRLGFQNHRPEVMVRSGFLGLYTSDDSTNRFSQGSCREQLLSEISRLINRYKNEEISITLTGHSMGSSLALLFGYDLAGLGLDVDGSNRKIPIAVYSFAGPTAVGNLEFKERCEELGLKVLRVVTVNDPVSMLQSSLTGHNLRGLKGRCELPFRCSCYARVGVELALEFDEMKSLSCVHCMRHLSRWFGTRFTELVFSFKLKRIT